MMIVGYRSLCPRSQCALRSSLINFFPSESFTFRTCSQLMMDAMGTRKKDPLLKRFLFLFLFQTETRPLLFTLSSHATRTTLFPFYPTTWMLNKFLSPPPPPLINIISATVRWIHPWRTPSSALQWVMITCYIKYHVLNIILMIIRDRANHWSSVVYEATFSLALHPLGSDLVWFHLHQIVIKCIGCIINQRQTGKRCWLLNDFFSSLSGYTSEGEGGWWCGCWASEGGKKCNVRSLPQFQFRVDRGKVFFGSAAERSVGQEGSQAGIRF